MSNNPFLLGWIRLERWSELTGEPVNTTRARIKNGGWVPDYHYTNRESRLWVHYERGQSWVNDPEQSQRKALKYVQAKTAAA